MMDRLFYFIPVFLMLTGIIAIIYCVLLKLMTPKRKQPHLMIIPLTQDNNPVCLVGAAIEKRNICGETLSCEIIAVDLGLSSDTLTFIKGMYSNSDKFTLCDYPNLGREIKNRLAAD